MNVLLVSSHAAPLTGGAAVVYDQLARATPGMSVLAPRIDYNSGAPTPGVAAFDAAAPYPVDRVALLRPMAHSWRAPFDKLQTLWRMAATLIAVARIARRRRIDVVCVGDLISLGWLAGAVQRFLRLPALLYVHGEEATYADASLFHRWRGDSLRRASGVVAVSSFTATLLETRYGVDRTKITLVPNGVDTDRFRPDPAGAARVRAARGIGDAPLIVGLGRLVGRKGYDTLIEAMPRVLARVPDVRCLIGGDGEMRSSLQARIDALGIGGAVELIGKVADDEIVALYSAATLFAMPNRTLENGDTEGFGLVFLEANACGAPAIGGRAGGATDAIDDGVSGLLVDSGDTAAVADAVIGVLTDPAFRERLSVGGAQKAANSTWRHAAARFQEACEKARAAFAQTA